MAEQLIFRQKGKIMSVSHIIGALSLIIIFGCIIWTSVNKKKHPEKYKNEKGNSFNILFGDFFSDVFKDSKDDYYYKNTKYGRRHTISLSDQFKRAISKRADSMNRYLNDNPDENNNKAFSNNDNNNNL